MRVGLCLILGYTNSIGGGSTRGGGGRARRGGSGRGVTTPRSAGVLIVKMLDSRFSPWARRVEFETTLHSRSFEVLKFFFVDTDRTGEGRCV